MQDDTLERFCEAVRKLEEEVAEEEQHTERRVAMFRAAFAAQREQRDQLQEKEVPTSELPRTVESFTDEAAAAAKRASAFSARGGSFSPEGLRGPGSFGPPITPGVPEPSRAGTFANPERKASAGTFGKDEESDGPDEWFPLETQSEPKPPEAGHPAPRSPKRSRK